MLEPELRSLGSRAARDVEESVGRDCAPNVERNQTEKCPPFVGSVAGCGRVASAKGHDGTGAGRDTRRMDHHAVVTAVLGTCKVEEIVGVQRLTSEGNVCQSSTPMARQTADDTSKVSQLSEEVGAWYAQRTSDVAIFTPGCWERVRFLEFPGEELRGATMAYCFPESEQEQMGEIDGRLVELEEPFVCDENEGEEKCNERLANYRQLMAHKMRKHAVRTVLGLLTRTNECPWCRSRFEDRETELHHVYNATETKGKCNINFSRWHHPLILPDVLQCRLCDHEAQDFEEFQLHARSHHPGPKGLSKLAMSAWRVAKRATPEGEGSSARDSKLPKSGGKGSMTAGARSAASYEDTVGRSIVALQN